MPERFIPIPYLEDVYAETETVPENYPVAYAMTKEAFNRGVHLIDDELFPAIMPEDAQLKEFIFDEYKLIGAVSHAMYDGQNASLHLLTSIYNTKTKHDVFYGPHFLEGKQIPNALGFYVELDAINGNSEAQAA